MKRTVISLLMVLILMFSLTACGASTGLEGNVAYDKMEMENGSAVSDSALESPNLPEDRKLIRTVRTQAETDDLTATMTQLEEKVSQFGGYLQQKEVYQGSSYRGTQYRNASLTIRIPAKDLDTFLSQLSSAAHVVSTNETVDDVTLYYIDVDSQLKALRTEEERLLAMMEKAENLADLLAIEQRLTQVQ